MEVIATSFGFYEGVRRRVGAQFDMSESVMKRDAKGRVILPDWVVPATEESALQIAKARQTDKRKDVEAIVASAGPKRPGVTAVRSVQSGYASAVENDNLI